MFLGSCCYGVESTIKIPPVESCLGMLEFHPLQMSQTFQEKLRYMYIVKNVMPINSITQNTQLTETDS